MYGDPNAPQPGDRVAYLGRVSHPRQKLEQQREVVQRYCDDNDLLLPESHWFEDKVRRHKQLKEGKNFNLLMEACQSGKFDWILIASFDRWGIVEKADAFQIAKELRELDVRLYVVADHLEITNTDDSTFWRIAAKAEGSTAYVKTIASNNIRKMHLMAKQGCAVSGNAAYGIDLVCYPLINSSPDLTRPLFRVIREKYIRPSVYRVKYYTDGREETSERMPLRDKKETVYRYERSEDPKRLEAVRLIYQYYDEGGNSFGRISDILDSLGYLHYDKPFGTHGVEAILRNPIYIGLPAFGKVGVGTYLISNGVEAVPPKRKRDGVLVIKKPKEQFVQPSEAIWEPIVDPEVWARVQDRLENRVKYDPSIGIARQRSNISHPLNGKVYCPECGEPMVVNSSDPKNKPEKVYYFICGKYRRTIRKQCHSNSFRFSKIDNAVSQLLDIVKNRIDRLTDHRMMETLKKEEWAKSTELGKLMAQVIEQAFGKEFEVKGSEQAIFDDPAAFAQWLWWQACESYNDNFATETVAARGRLGEIETELERIGDTLIAGVPSSTVKDKLNKRMIELEHEKASLHSKIVPLTAKAELLRGRLESIKHTIVQQETVEISRLLDAFIERVIPHFEGEYKRGCERPITFEFIPRAGNSVLTEGLKIGDNRTNMGLLSLPIFELIACMFSIPKLP